MSALALAPGASTTATGALATGDGNGASLLDLCELGAVKGERTREAPPRTAEVDGSAGEPVLAGSCSQELVAGVVIASRLVRTNAVTVNDVLDRHKLLEIDCVDRVNLTLSVRNLQSG